MINVRYPNGQVISYPHASFLDYGEDGRFRLLTCQPSESNSRSVAIIQGSAGVTIDWGSTAYLSNPMAALSVDSALEKLIGEIRGATDPRKVAKLKRLLHRFNAVTRTWRD